VSCGWTVLLPHQQPSRINSVAFTKSLPFTRSCKCLCVEASIIFFRAFFYASLIKFKVTTREDPFISLAFNLYCSCLAIISFPSERLDVLESFPSKTHRRGHQNEKSEFSSPRKKKSHGNKEITALRNIRRSLHFEYLLPLKLVLIGLHRNGSDLILN
jgi:hypothetical protein